MKSAILLVLEVSRRGVTCGPDWGDAMSLAGVQDVAFGPFRLSVRQRTLSDRNGPVPLPSRAFDVLVTLFEGRAAVISKKVLIGRVWGDISVEENILHVQISHVRRAQGTVAVR